MSTESTAVEMPGAAKSIEVMRTFWARLHVAGEGRLPDLNRLALSQAVSGVGRAVQSILALLQDFSAIKTDDLGVCSADVFVPMRPEDAERIARNINKPLAPIRSEAGAKESGRPRYRNSYRLEEIGFKNELRCLRFRIAARFFWQPRIQDQSKILCDLDMLPAKFFQQVIASWLKPPILQEIPKGLRNGVCQQAAQQFLSHIGLLNKPRIAKTAYPSTAERVPERRLDRWQTALKAVCADLNEFQYVKVRDLYPNHYDADDPRGDRLVNVDPNWIDFMRSPFVRPLPLNFIDSDAVIVYERRWQEAVRGGRAPRALQRLYAALPVFAGVSPDSALGRVMQDTKLFWWRRHLEEFTALPAWAGARLRADAPCLVVPLEYDPDRGPDKPSRFRQAFAGLDGRRVNWSVLVQRHERHQPNPEWQIHFATSKEVVAAVRSNVLGIHFQDDPIIAWTLVDGADRIIKEGQWQGNEILAQGLAEKLALEKNQRAMRWIGGQTFAADLKRRAFEVAHRIVDFAVRYDANLALEEITWVDKMGSDSTANKRFSMWNFSQLASLIEWLGLERPTPPVMTLRHVNDYLLKYTCPKCGACRKGKETIEQAATWRSNGLFQCRKCGFTGVIPEADQARLVARLGAERLRNKLAH